jgi:hypothetical protein
LAAALDDDGDGDDCGGGNRTLAPAPLSHEM